MQTLLNRGGGNIFLPTVQHTGTWFGLNLLYAHSQVSCVLDGGITLFSNHGLLYKNRMVVQTHIGEGNDPIEWEKMIQFAGISPVISTVRDPLAALITRQTRHPEVSHCCIIDGFLNLIHFTEVQDVFILPVDLYAAKPVEERLAFLHKLLEFVGLPSESYIFLWALAWPVHNTTPEGPGGILHSSYIAGDLGPIIQAMPEEYEYLKSQEGILKPFLQRQGYENLIWWEKE